MDSISITVLITICLFLLFLSYKSYEAYIEYQYELSTLTQKYKWYEIDLHNYENRRNIYICPNCKELLGLEVYDTGKCKGCGWTLPTSKPEKPIPPKFPQWIILSWMTLAGNVLLGFAVYFIPNFDTAFLVLGLILGGIFGLYMHFKLVSHPSYPIRMALAGGIITIGVFAYIGIGAGLLLRLIPVAIAELLSHIF